VHAVTVVSVLTVALSRVIVSAPSELTEKSHKYVLEFQIAHRTVWILWHTTRSRAAFAYRHHIQHNRISEHHPLADVDVFGVQNLHLQIVVTRVTEASIFPEQERAHSGVIEIDWNQT